MKRIIASMLFVVCLFGMSGCHSVVEAQIDCGASELYTLEEREAAVRVIKNRFRLWALRGYELHRIAYGGDEACSEKNLAELNDLNSADGPKKPFVQCIMFTSDFHTAEEYRGDGFEEDSEYTGWQWWLARTDGGRWKIVTCRYG